MGPIAIMCTRQDCSLPDSSSRRILSSASSRGGPTWTSTWPSSVAAPAPDSAASRIASISTARMDSDYFHYYASNEHFDMHYVKKIIAVDVYIDSPIVKFVGDITKNRDKYGILFMQFCADSLLNRYLLLQYNAYHGYGQ